MRNTVVLVRHGDDPPDDRVHTWMTQCGFRIETRKPFAGDRLESPDSTVAGSVIYGGPFNVDETGKHRFLLDEYLWIDACLQNSIPLLGICQGAQQIALHLGAWAGAPGEERHEFGYYRVNPCAGCEDFMSHPLYFAQAHYHTYDLPHGARQLASSEAFNQQAFQYGENTFGFQFHAEQTIEGFRRWQHADWAAWGKPGAQTRAEQDKLMLAHDAAQADWFYAFLSRLFGKPGL